jgi:hypothetical protein
MLREKNVRRLVCVTFALAAMLAALTGSASADLLTYDFEGLSNGALIGQDSWAQAFTWISPTVGDGTAGSGDTSKVVYGRPVSEGGAGAYRPISTLTFSSTSNAHEAQAFEQYIASGDTGAVAGLVFDPDHRQRNVFGFQTDYTHDFTDYVRVADGTEYWGATPGPKNHLYEIKLEMDFSVAGGLATFYRKDITAGTDFAIDPWLTNVPMGLAPDGQGRYSASQLVVRVDASPNSYIDNFTVTPEPGTCALMTTALFGLLAYAWRRRR